MNTEQKKTHDLRKRVFTMLSITIQKLYHNTGPQLKTNTKINKTVTLSDGGLYRLVGISEGKYQREKINLILKWTVLG